MAWWQIVGVAVGVLAGLAAARKFLWAVLKGMVALGDVLPHLMDLPGKLDEVAEKADRNYGATQRVSDELREHMRYEDEIQLIEQKGWAGMITRQERVEHVMSGVQLEVNNVRQIVMNVVETGAGDRWRLDQVAPPLDSVPVSDPPPEPPAIPL